MAQTSSIILNAGDRERLVAIVAERNRPHKHVQRVRIILHSDERRPVLAIAKRVGVSRPAVWRWQQRFAEQGVVATHALRKAVRIRIGSRRSHDPAVRMADRSFAGAGLLSRESLEKPRNRRHTSKVAALEASLESVDNVDRRFAPPRRVRVL
jgi:hypothetical protein